MFDIKKLLSTIDARIESLNNAEKIVREELRSLSRDVLYALHEHGNIEVVNKVVQANLTPVNRKAILVFFKEWTGFHYDDVAKMFTKKNKAKYDDKKKACLEALNEDPHFNFWSWADREIEVQAKGFDPKRVTKFIENQIKKAEKDGFKQSDVIRAILAAGIEVDTLVEILDAQAA